MKIYKINFYDQPDHINTYLTHWTGKDKDDQRAFDNLMKIVETKELKFSQNQTSFSNPTTTVTNLMICFTDTPIRHSLEHCKKYGYFGISFNKERLIHYGANPVLYLTDNRQENQEFLNNLYFFRNDESLRINWISAVTQPYNTKPNDPNHYPEFLEREWRIAGRVLPHHYLETAEQHQGTHDEYPFEGEIRRQQNSTNLNDEDFFLQFSTDIIENIIVASGFKKEAEKLLIQNKLNCELILLTKQ